jgi:hypothetical protein
VRRFLQLLDDILGEPEGRDRDRRDKDQRDMGRSDKYRHDEDDY